MTAAIAQFETVPAPMGGINAVSGLMEMPPTDALYALNMIFTQNGPTVRPGYTEWANTIGGTAGVLTVIAVRGAGTAGTQDHLFACTNQGIYDVSASIISPTPVVTFGTQTGNAGYCEYDFSVNAAGDVTLLVCDEVNGYYTFDCSTSTWTKITQAFTGTGSSSGTTLTIATTVSGTIQAGAEVYTYSGTTLTDTGVHVVSGSGPYTLSGSPALAANSNIVIMSTTQVWGVDPATLVKPRVFQAFVWFVQGGSGVAYYGLAGGGFLGQFTPFGWGNKFPHGGNLKTLEIFTYGSAFGTYTYLVGIGDAGDVLAYQGINPSNSSTWTLAGQWFIGDVPAGRRFACNYGGDLTIICAYGIIKISSLFSQQNVDDPNQHLDKKIAPAMAADFNLYSGLWGWQIVPWPAQNSLMILEPIQANLTNKQWCYNLATSAWSIFNGPPWQCAAFWHGNLYAGTPDSRVIQQSGYVDNTLLGGTQGMAINFGLLCAFQKGKIQSGKFVDFVQAYFVENSPISWTTFCQFDFDLTPLALGAVTSAPNPVQNGWDSGIWDSALWNAGATTATISVNKILGNSGIGKWFAIGLLGSSQAAATLAGFEVSLRPVKGFFV